MALGLGDVGAAISRWAAEAEVGAPVADSQLVVLAVTGDIDSLRAALDLNRRWRIALGEGDRTAIGDLLQEAAAMVGAKT